MSTMDCDYCDGALDPEEAEEALADGRAICDECLAAERAAELAAAAAWSEEHDLLDVE